MTEVGSPLSIEEVSPVDIGPRDVVVRIGASGLCHSDLLFLDGQGPTPPPLVLGHEGAGIVEETGFEVRTVRPGDRVICSWIPSCGQCWYCVRGQSRLCGELASLAGEHKLRRHGGGTAARMLGVGSFAEAAVLDERSLVRVETDLPDEQLALIGCGVTTGVGAAVNTAQVSPGSAVAVVGCGGVGQSVIQGARIAGAGRIVAIDPVELKRTTALALGATDAIDPASTDAVEEVRALTGGRGADYTFEVTGLEQVLDMTFSATRPGGAVVLVGVQPALARIPWAPLVQLLQEKRLLTAWYGSAEVRRDFPRLVTLAESGRLDLASMVSRRIALDQVNEGLEAIERGEVIRSVIVN
jgi:S-(hydroxymethyl)glutathione dehydrogenase/alcohol dehydrogenase